MPEFVPFAGLRYNLEKCSPDDVIAPPYDVVEENERVLLAQRSPYNAIHVELPVPDEIARLDRYAHAARIFAAWQSNGGVLRDDAPSFYVYRMRFFDGTATPRSTTGVLGALRIDEANGHEVLPHEQTMPKPKGDRLELMRACRANLSPIWGLSLSPGLAQACEGSTKKAMPTMSATDDEGTVHELWPISDQGALRGIADLVCSTPVVLADGHHRYETARYYRNERRSELGDKPGEHDYVMAFVVELSEEELFVQAIHRLVSGWAAEIDLEGDLGGSFEVLPGPLDLDDLARAMVEHGALGCVRAHANLLLIPRPSLDAAADADLDSSRLDVFLASMTPCELSYQHGLKNVHDAIANGTAQVAFLLRPATVRQIAETAHSGRLMPPKTTFFQPKPRTGMVYRSVRS